MRFIYITVITLTGFAAALVFNNCSTEGTTTGNPLVAINIESYNVSSAGKILAVQGATESAISVQEMKLCFKRLRFKLDSSGPQDLGEDIDLELGEVTITPAGIGITSVEVPPGVYDRVEFDLENQCSTGHSLMVTNGNGTFFTTEGVTIRFEGSFVVTEGSEILNLSIGVIADALSEVNANDAVRGLAESASGSF